MDRIRERLKAVIAAGASILQSLLANVECRQLSSSYVHRISTIDEYCGPCEVAYDLSTFFRVVKSLRGLSL